MLKPGDIAIVSGARTPFGRYCGKLKDFTAQELGAVAGKGAIERAGIDPKEFDHAVFGNAQQTSGDALYGARHVGLRAGLPIETPALTVNRLCGSGMQSIVSGAQMIQLDEAKIVLACGMGAMSQAPFVIRGRDGFTLAPGGKLEDSLMVALLDSYCNLYMANTAELLGSEFGITREMQDEFALRSQQKADAAYKEGRIQEELVPVPLKNSKGEATGESLTEDDHRRPQTTLEGLAKLKAAFGKNGTVTAGNASGIVDGAAAVVLMSLEEARKRSIEPLGRRSYWPILEACAANNFPVSLHLGGTAGHASTGGGVVSFYHEEHPSYVQSMAALVTSLVCEGVFEHLPNLKVVLVEGGFAWLPALCWRLDNTWKALKAEVPFLRRKPSEYVRENIWVTTQPIE